MKAIVCTKSGPPEVLRLEELEPPTPKDKEVLVRVRAATVTRGDVILRKLHPLVALLMGVFGVKKMKIPGIEFAGEITDLGKDIVKFKVGEKVFGTTTGLRFGANAEYVCVPETSKQGVLGLMPNKATFEEAAGLPVGGMTALYLLQKADLKPGDKVLVYGASGSVGTYAVQLAKQVFDAQVTGVCSTRNLELVKSLGAKEVIDYTQEDFLQREQTYDLIFDAVGKLSSLQVKTILTEGGAFLTVRTPTRETLENLANLKNLFDAGKLKPVIDRTFPLAEVADAHRYVETGRKQGNVVITVASSESGVKE
jgi:NADPH:quinone reductase-like Zn-dependent oxidoreductase